MLSHQNTVLLCIVHQKKKKACFVYTLHLSWRRLLHFKRQWLSVYANLQIAETERSQQNRNASNNGIAATGGRGDEGSMATNLEVNNHHHQYDSTNYFDPHHNHPISLQLV